MNSKEALDNLVHCKSITKCKECRHKNLCTMERDYNIIKQDLDRLEKENQELKEKFKMLEENEEVVLTTLEIAVQENIKMKKALDKSCEMLDYTCPVEEELIDDLDCENCKDNYKECWKKFFLKEVLK